MYRCSPSFVQGSSLFHPREDPGNEVAKYHGLWRQPGSSFSFVLSNSSFCGTNMSQKCIKISSCVCFFIFSGGLLVLFHIFFEIRGVNREYTTNRWRFRNLTLTFQDQFEGQVQCGLRDISSDLNTPSLESYIRASPAVEGQELGLSGLAVFSKLANACQPLVDINKSKFQGNKFALISLREEFLWPGCTLQDLAENAQNAGYSVVIYYFRSAPLSDDNGMQTDTKDKLLIPVLYANLTTCLGAFEQGMGEVSPLDGADQRNVDIGVQTDELTKMRRYLARLYYWFLLGPVITLEWLRRTKRPRFMSGALQQDHEESAIEDERSVGEGGLRSEAQEPVANYDQETDYEQTAGEGQPLIVVVNDPVMTTTRN